MATRLYRLKKEIDEQTPGDEPPWKVYGRIRLKTGVSLGSLEEDDEVSPETYEQVREAAEEILGERLGRPRAV